MSPRVINIITNIVAILLAVLEPVKAYLASQPFDWTTFILCILGAIISYFTGKSGMSAVKMLRKNPHDISGEPNA